MLSYEILAIEAASTSITTSLIPCIYVLFLEFDLLGETTLQRLLGITTDPLGIWEFIDLLSGLLRTFHVLFLKGKMKIR